jgi:hypothetical protein
VHMQCSLGDCGHYERVTGASETVGLTATERFCVPQLIA